MLLCKDNSLVGRVNEQVVSLEKEVAVLKQLDHPNIVRYLVSIPLYVVLWRASLRPIGWVDIGMCREQNGQMSV